MKKIVSVLVILMLLIASLFVLTGCDKTGGESENNSQKVELNTVDVTYKYPWDGPVWKNYTVTIGYPKNDNWVVQENEDSKNKVKLVDETRKLTCEFNAGQVSKTTWEQNTKVEKERFSVEQDKKWSNELEGYSYTISFNTYKGVIFLGNPSSISDGAKGTHVNKLEFDIKAGGSSDTMLSLEEITRIMDEEIIPNITWKEIDE